MTNRANSCQAETSMTRWQVQRRSHLRKGKRRSVIQVQANRNVSSIGHLSLKSDNQKKRGRQRCGEYSFFPFDQWLLNHSFPYIQVSYNYSPICCSPNPRSKCVSKEPRTLLYYLSNRYMRAVLVRPTPYVQFPLHPSPSFDLSL